MTSAVDCRIGRNVRRLRVERGLACAALAALLCISESSLRAYELGEQRMPPELFLQLAMSMDVSISAFFDVNEVHGVAPSLHPAARLH